MRRRGIPRSEEGWSDGIIVLESLRKRGGAALSDFSTLRPIFKKVCFQALRLQEPCGQNDAIRVRFAK